MEKAFVTGANGFIGSHVCRELAAAGYDVTGLVRPSSDLHFLEGLDVRLVSGDLNAPGTIDIPPDTAAVVHSASVVSDFADEAECRARIFDLTANLVGRLKELGCRTKRLVYISTSLTLGYGRLDISEDKPGKPVSFMPYARMKIETENFLKGLHRREELPVVILRPADVFGPKDRTTCALILRGCRRGVPMIVGHGDWYFPFCYIDNLCQAVRLALAVPGIEGRAFTVTNGQLVTWREFYSEIYALLGRRQRFFPPIWLARVLAALQEGVHSLLPRYTPSLTRYRIARATNHTTYDISRTIAELGYKPAQDVKSQIKAIVGWYLEERNIGYLP
jgi:nucleoside-diphosphate-sugar epimerase